MITNSVVTRKTADEHILYGLMRRELKTSSDTILIHIHGTGSNFFWEEYYEPVAEKLAESNIDFLTTNNHGSGVYELDKWSVPTGAALEKFEDCVLDIDAWIEWAVENNYKKIVLVGHSLGTEKVVYYMEKGSYKDRVRAVILLGFCDSVGAQKRYLDSLGKDSLQYLEEAKTLCEHGENTKLLSDSLGNCGEVPISGQTYLNFFSEDSELSKVLPFHKRRLEMLCKIQVPILGVISDRDDEEYTIIPIKEAMLLLEKENSLVNTYQILQTGHNFEKKEKELAEVISDFINNLYLG